MPWPPQKELERFGKAWNQLRARRIFRDDASLSARSALWGSITQVMGNAPWLVLIATPGAAESEYVERELEWWLSHKDSDSILLVHAAGHLEWDRSRNCFTDSSTAIPAILRNAFDEEPRWTDLTWFDDPGSVEDPRFTERLADLAAAISGTDRDALYGENLRQHRRALRLARTGVAILLVLL
ncbi:MAG: hypothetical protein Q4F67_08775, partial [Propionibacteriaceae bacterium]|nr:hypothetical protein [Propionibacteriaceae bacterium]